MKKKFSVAAVLVAALGAGASTASAQDVLSGDTRLACEAILCLSTGSRPSECSPSLSRYFSIKKKKFSDTIKARLNFLDMCPVASQTPEMRTLVSAISRGAGQCDAASLNQTVVYWSGNWDSGETYISDRMPDYCAAYTGHAYTDFNTGGFIPRYVGTPERGGYWVEAKDYDRALAAYKARIEAEDRARYSGN